MGCCGTADDVNVMALEAANDDELRLSIAYEDGNARLETANGRVPVVIQVCETLQERCELGLLKLN